MPKVSLNLAESYVPEWGTWEVGREQICNAIDADKNHDMKLLSSDELVLRTQSVPSIAELCIIGASTKRNSDETIGQFGEGFKLACLVTARMGGETEVMTPEGKLTFSLEKAVGIIDRVLHANIDKRKKVLEGCVIKVRLPGIGAAIQGKFCERNAVRIDKTSLSPCKVFVKGVFIQKLQVGSIWDWNIKIKVNRDRAAVDNYLFKWEIARELFDRNIFSKQDYEKVLRNDRSLEHSSIGTLYERDYACAPIVREAWASCYGEKAVIASSRAVVNEIAYAKGYPTVYAERELRYFGIKTADEVVSLSDEIEEVEAPQNILDECDRALDLMEIPAAVGFYKDKGSEQLGKAEWRDGVALAWLNDRLLKPGMRTKRLTVLAHELCHIEGRVSDGSVAFEMQLSEICGKLLAKLI